MLKAVFSASDFVESEVLLPGLNLQPQWRGQEIGFTTTRQEHIQAVRLLGFPPNLLPKNLDKGGVERRILEGTVRETGTRDD